MMTNLCKRDQIRCGVVAFDSVTSGRNWLYAKHSVIRVSHSFVVSLFCLLYVKLENHRRIMNASCLWVLRRKNRDNYGSVWVNQGLTRKKINWKIVPK